MTFLASHWSLAVAGGSTVSLWVSAYEVTVKSYIDDTPPLQQPGIAGQVGWGGAASRQVKLDGLVQTEADANALESALRNNSLVTLTSDLGAEGTYKLVSFTAPRIEALNTADNIYKVQVGLVRSQ